jgi:hypothetical protein
MDQNVNKARTDELADRKTARKILFLVAVISTIYGTLYFIGLMGKLLANGSIHAASSPAVSMVSAAIGLLWDITLVILFATLRRQINPGKAVFADHGMAFVLLMAAGSSLNWYIQLVLVPRIAQPGDAIILALLDIHNVRSIMYAMEHLSWRLFYGLAVIFMALAIEGGKIESWIHWLLIVGGGMSIAYIPDILSANQFLIDLGYYAAGVLLPITTVLLAIKYGK